MMHKVWCYLGEVPFSFSRSSVKFQGHMAKKIGDFGPNWSNCHEMKCKHIDWTQGLKYDHWVWPWPWSWPWIFKVKYGIYYISANIGPIATKRKANISTGLKASNVTVRFDLGHDLELEFSRSNMEFAISQLKMVRLPQNKRQIYQLNIRPQMWPSGLTLALTLTMTLNFFSTLTKVKYGICFISTKSGPIANCWLAMAKPVTCGELPAWLMAKCNS